MPRGKSWRREEDLGLVRAIAATLRDASSLECGTSVFWQRVGAELAQLLAEDVRATPRTPTAVEKRWKTMQPPLVAFTSSFQAASRAHNALSDADCVHTALDRFQEENPTHRPFEHLEVWQLLRREVPRYEDLITSSTSSYVTHQRLRESVRASEDESVSLLPTAKRRRQPTDGDSAETVVVVVGEGGDNDTDSTNDSRDRSNDARDGTQDASQTQEPPSSSEVGQSDAAAYWKAKLDAVATRNALLAEQNAIATERNLLLLFAHRDDALSTEFFDLKRRLELAKLRRAVAESE